MCQAYDSDSEIGFYFFLKREDKRRGKPDFCDFQAGYFQCPNKYSNSQIQETFDSKTRERWWECKDCGSKFPYIKD